MAGTSSPIFPEPVMLTISKEAIAAAMTAYGPDADAKNMQRAVQAFMKKAVEVSRAAQPHKMASYEDGLPVGLYVFYWESGGSSEVAVGMGRDGKRWMAPTNWQEPLNSWGASSGSWSSIKAVQPLSPIERNMSDD